MNQDPNEVHAVYLLSLFHLLTVSLSIFFLCHWLVGQMCPVDLNHNFFQKHLEKNVYYESDFRCSSKSQTLHGDIQIGINCLESNLGICMRHLKNIYIFLSVFFFFVFRNISSKVLEMWLIMYSDVTLSLLLIMKIFSNLSVR